MSYFSPFPLAAVPLDKENLKIVQAKNILLRAKFSDYYKQSGTLFEPYTILDGDRPDTLAHKIYGRSDLHWIILLFNEIIDPYYEWPLTQKQMEEYMNYKYPGKAIYVSDSFLYANGPKTDTPISNTEPTIVGETVATIGTGVGSIPVKILSYDPLLAKMVVTGADSVSMGPVNKTLYITNTNGNQIKCEINYIEENKTALHHFEDFFSNWVDPRGRINQTEGGNTTERIRVYTSINRPQPGYLGDISNQQYEELLNENKRRISVLKPSYVNSVIRQFTELLKPKPITRM